MKAKLISILASAAGLLVAAVQPVFGSPLPTGFYVGFSYSTSNLTGCAPTVSGVLGNKHITDTLDSDLTTWTLFTLSPPGCTFSGDSKEKFTLTFAITGVAATTGNATETGWYTARYSGVVLPCAASDPASTHGQSDCINWDPAHSLIEFALGGADTGYFLDITLHDAVDWNILPTVTYQLVTAPHQQTPEPGTLALLGLGLAGLAALRRRKQ
jgi:hypothetical protein